MGNKLCCVRSEEVSVFDYLVKRTILIVTDEDVNDRSTIPMIELLQRLNNDEEAFWQLGESMIRLAPADEVYAVNIINMLMQQCCLPSPGLLVSCGERFKLHALLEDVAHNTNAVINVCLILGCLAFRYAGQRAVLLLQDDVCSFLLRCLQLNAGIYSTIVLSALFALERFSLTTENKLKVQKELANLGEKNPLFYLKQLVTEMHRVKFHKLGFVATWMLDNTFKFEEHKATYKMTKVHNLNVNLNVGSIASALMLSPDGLEVRSNIVPFETVRSSFSVREGVWYYEVTLVTDGVLQIGWMSTFSEVDPQQGSGVGDDLGSVGFDGCRQYIWYNGDHMKHRHRWKPGDVVGCLIDFNQSVVVFSLNGKCLSPFKPIFRHIIDKDMVAAASLMTFQQCIFNFGRTPFKYAPSGPFQALNDHASPSEDQLLVLPRSQMRMRDNSLTESLANPCCICMTHEANAELSPCGHGGICKACAKQVSTCPFCREMTVGWALVRRQSCRLTPSNSVVNESGPSRLERSDSSRADPRKSGRLEETDKAPADR